MFAPPLGETTPPGLFDDQPEAVIFDPNRLIRDRQQQLQPFYSFVHVIETENELLMFLSSKSRKTVILILLLPDRTEDNVKTFLNNHIITQQSINSFYLVFTNGYQHQWTLRGRFDPLLIDCWSITEQLDSDIREALSTANDLNVKFCYRRAKEEEIRGNNSLVSIYEQQRRERLTFQILYDKILIANIDNDRR